MKRIIFSFDDGLLDFYKITYPILKKYNIVASFNVATGLVDKTIKDGYDYCTIEQIKELLNYGIEIALHSNSHSKTTTTEDLDIALNKLSKWIGLNNIHGLVIPYNIPPTDNVYRWMKKNKIRYLRGGDISIVHFYHRILFRLHKLTKKQLHVNNNSRLYSKGNLTFVPSFPIWLEKDVSYYTNIINMAPKNGTITFMFHSIYPTVNECMDTPYPEGAWTAEKFERLICWVLKNGFEIVAQKDVIVK